MTGDTPFSAFRAAARSEDAGWEVRAWLLLGMTALAIAGVFALFLALSRVPGTENLIPWPLHFFEKGLVIHVVYSFVVWFLCLLGALAAGATYHLDDGRSRGRSTGRSAVWMVAAGQILLMIPAVEHATEASLNNYVPTIIDPLYYLGLVFLFMGVLFVVIRLLAAFLRRANQPGPDGLGILLTTAAYIAAFICFRRDLPRGLGRAGFGGIERTPVLGRRACPAIRQCGPDALCLVRPGVPGGAPPVRQPVLCRDGGTYPVFLHRPGRCTGFSPCSARTRPRLLPTCSTCWARPPLCWRQRS